MNRYLIVAVVLILPALLTIPLERQIHSERARLKYGGAKLTPELRDQLGQGMAIGLLAGFRGIVADFLWIQGHAFWEKKEWIRMYRNMKVVTTLQPQSVMFWELSQWHIAWNIAYAVRTDPQNRSEAEGIKREREWIEQARLMLLDGISNVPNRYELYFAMGWLHWHKIENFCVAAEYLGRASQFQEAPSYVSRLYARALEKCGETHAAYEHWRSLWSSDHSRKGQLWGVVEREIRRLEDELKIPKEQRIFPDPLPAVELPTTPSPPLPEP
jgi:hypothetical protein